jgi:hypothetical protein
VAALLLGAVTLASAQNRLKATSAAAFLREPGGLRLGTLVSGVSYQTGRSTNGHLETTVEGWIPIKSATASAREGFDLSVTSGNGESVRAAPNGSVVARIQEGTLLSKTGTRGTWVRVRRLGWVARRSFGAPDVVATAPATLPTRQTAPPPPATVPPSPLRKTSGDTARKLDASKSDSVSSGSAVRKGAEVMGGPEGQRIALLDQATDVRVLERQRDWVKVQIEGWVHAADIANATTGPRITAAMLREKPDRFVGQTVNWRLQFLAIQEADDLRPEIPRGQSYILARGPLPESGFVYLMVTKEQETGFRALAPLDEVVVEAVIRAGRTKYLPTPVLALVNVAR